MAHSLVWLDQAKQDVREILTYIADEKPRAAIHDIRGIRETAERLREFPGLGRQFSDHYRVLVHRNHLNLLFLGQGAAHGQNRTCH